MKPLLISTQKHLLLLLKTTVFLVFFIVAISGEKLPGDFFKICKVPAQCGNQTISFPFFIDGVQEPFCGFPGFQISCNTEIGRPILKLSGDDDYVIHEIFYHNTSLIVSNLAFLWLAVKDNYKCLSINDLTLPEDHRFRLASNKTRTVKKCHNESFVRVPVMEWADDGLGEALRGGFMVNWIASDCGWCERTNGKCGFDYETRHFQCFCPDRPHAARCGPHKGDRAMQLKLGLGLGVPLGILICLIIGFFISRHYIRRRNAILTRNISETSMNADAEGGCVYYGIPLFSYKDLEKATNNFDSEKELGDGGFGTVYHGVLKDGRQVAVKRLYEHNYRRVEQFMNEIEILTRLRHRNLVALYGCTSHKSRELLLVYEYISNGTVADHLHGDRAKDSPLLDWRLRMSIAIETATALAYLHASDTVHRDVKTNNILLDHNFCVKVADFGLSRLFPNDVTHVSTAPQGTPGYVDPEYHQCYQLTSKSDVYSFGVVLVELVSSMPAVDITRHRQEINLSNLATGKIKRRAFGELVDPHLGFGSDSEATRMITAVAMLAFQCLQQDKEMRPTMEEVLNELNRIESNDDVAIPVSILPLSPECDDEACLLKSNRNEKDEEEEPRSPNTVTQNWPSSNSTTPNTSSDSARFQAK